MIYSWRPANRFQSKWSFWFEIQLNSRYYRKLRTFNVESHQEWVGWIKNVSVCSTNRIVMQIVFIFNPTTLIHCSYCTYFFNWFKIGYQRARKMYKLLLMFIYKLSHHWAPTSAETTFCYYCSLAKKMIANWSTLSSHRTNNLYSHFETRTKKYLS